MYQLFAMMLLPAGFRAFFRLLGMRIVGREERLLRF